MRRLRARYALLAAAILSLPASAAARAIDELTPHASAPPRVPAQARTLVKYIASGSIDIASALPGATGLGGGLAIDGAGNLYVDVVRSSRGQVAVFDPQGRLQRTFFVDGNPGLPPGYSFSGRTPTLLAVGPDNLLYVRNANESFMRVYQPDGTFVRAFGNRVLSGNNTGDLEVDAAGNVYTINLDRIVKFNPAGVVVGEFQPVPGIHPDRLLGLAVAPDGSLYVTVDPQLTGLPEEPPHLVHLDASGRRLPDPAPLLYRLMGAHGPHGYGAKDVDFANGRLYIAGHTRQPSALGVITPSGELVDVISGRRGEQVAVRGESVHVTGLTNRPTARTTAQAVLDIGQLKGVDVFFSAPPGAAAGLLCPEANRSVSSGEFGGPQLLFRGVVRPECQTWFANKGSPCGSGDIHTPRKVFLGGEQLDVELEFFRREDQFQFRIPSDQITSGQVVVEWSCVDKTTNEIEVKYEWKGGITVLIDPSGNVFDAKTGRAIAGATVRLQFSPQKGGPFGTPSANAYTPQIHPQTTGGDGFFGWDVAEGFWRLQITAFGYKPFTSTVYKVPPEVKGLKLKLRPDPRQQARVIEPHAGRAGSVRIGAKLKARRIAGLQPKIVRGRVRSITVRSRAYRTILGVRLGTPSMDLIQAYPTRARTAMTRLLTSRKAVQHRVGKATFTVRRGRVVGIKLGR
jgi:hypothetical protein